MNKPFSLTVPTVYAEAAELTQAELFRSSEPLPRQQQTISKPFSPLEFELCCSRTYSPAAPPPQELVWISPPETGDGPELAEEDIPPKAGKFTEGAPSLCAPVATGRAVSESPISDPGVLRTLGAPTLWDEPLLPSRRTLGRPPLEASDRPLQCTQGLLH